MRAQPGQRVDQQGHVAARMQIADMQNRRAFTARQERRGRAWASHERGADTERHHAQPLVRDAVGGAGARSVTGSPRRVAAVGIPLRAARIADVVNRQHERMDTPRRRRVGGRMEDVEPRAPRATGQRRERPSEIARQPGRGRHDGNRRPTGRTSGFPSDSSFT